ncbi:MAG: HD domain-containing protein [Candidatus Cybelea sp.]|jgi:uncharacterized protein
MTIALGAIFAALVAVVQPAQTATGIPLDAAWKVTIYDLARSKFHHPAWGWQHSERNYRIALELAKGDGLRVDTDVLFAAAFLHDMAAFMPCVDTKLEHGECAAQQTGAILRAAGFPMEKLAAVEAAERGHMYYSNPGKQPEAIVLHDADSLDFLGDIGAARMISLAGASAESFVREVKTLRSFVHDIPPRLITKTAQAMGAVRAAELERFLDTLNTETFDGQAM